MLETDGSVIILTENTARIMGDALNTIVTEHDCGDIEIKQEGDETSVYLFRDEAEALFLVLDTMLHPDEE